MGGKDDIPVMPKDPPPEKKPKPKFCCACPETKAARDECIARNGEKHVRCRYLIESHKLCLRNEGFNV